jgi:hypothetical protein
VNISYGPFLWAVPRGKIHTFEEQKGEITTAVDSIPEQTLAAEYWLQKNHMLNLLQ